jgi:hypothetical protein
VDVIYWLWLDKLVDEMAKGKKMEKVLRIDFIY